MFDLRRLSRLFCAVVLLFAACGMAFAEDPRIIYEKEAHVGEEVVLSVESVPSDASLEWAVSGNVNPILLRGGGRECAFTPIDMSPITVTATLRSRNGEVLGTTKQEVNPKEFTVAISVVVDEPVLLWNPIERADTQADALLTKRPIHLRAKLEPPFNGVHSFNWTVDAATAKLSESTEADINIQRSQTGDSEIFVTAFNASGVRMGSGGGVVSVTLPLSTFEESEKSRKAWQDWQAALPLWEEKKYDEAIELAKMAQAAAPRDPDIADGVKAMSTNYARYLRAEGLRKKSEEERRQKQLDDALRDLRLAHVVWPMPDDEKTIQEVEKEVDEFRVLVQKANWLRDTASAYDQEGMYEEAMDYYAKSIAMVQSDAVKSRMERIKARLDMMSEADRYAGEGSVLEREGQLREALEAYNASLKSNPDAALRQHAAELQNAISRREKQAANLYSEGMTLERKGSFVEALQKYKDSNSLWETPGALDRIEELEKTVKSSAPVRKPEDFGIGTKADAAKLIGAGDKMYLQRRIEEAVALYRKSLALSPNDELRAWVTSLEEILRDRKTSKAANALIREGNALYRAGKIDAAAAKYRESLKEHPNAEVSSFLKKNNIPADTEPQQDAKAKRKK